MQETACENLSNGTTEIYDIDVFWMFHSTRDPWSHSSVVTTISIKNRKALIIGPISITYERERHFSL